MACTRFLLPLVLFALTVTGAACSDAMSDPGPTSKDVSGKGDDEEGTSGSSDPGGSSGKGTGSSSTSGSPATTGGTTAGGSTAGPDAGGETTGGTTGGAIPFGPTTAEVLAAAGNVTFDLSTANTQLTGAKVTATMSVQAGAGGQPGSVALTGILVESPTASGFQLYRPVVVVTSPEIDPATGKPRETSTQIGSNINFSMPAKRIAPLSVRFVTANGYVTGSKVKLRFSALMPASPTSVTGLTQYKECKSPATFASWAGTIGQACQNCHPFYAFELLGKDNATACGQNLWLINDAIRDATLNPRAVNLQTPLSADTHRNGTAPATYGTTLNAWRQAEGP